MEVQTLKLINFRNYEYEEISFCPGTNLIYGDNAQGKTNLLEAVCMFSQGRSKRVKSDNELIRFGQNGYTLEMTFSDAVREHCAVIRFSSAGKKNIHINNVAIKKLSQLMSFFNVVMFSPSELDIIKGSPSVRRRFIDEAISQLSPKYMSQLSQYYKTLNEKNSLLKQLRVKNIKSDAMLSVWNEQLAEAGCEICKKRKNFIEKIAVSAAAMQQEISGEKLGISYRPSVTAEEYFEKLEQNQQREIEFGSALVGIQRDDMAIKIADKESRLYASQGQQRTAVLSLKLAQTEHICEERGEYPVILLDDIMSELDINRRRYLAGKIKGRQVLMTTTDAENTEDGNTQYFKITNGRVG